MFTICGFCPWVEKSLIVRLINLNTFADGDTDCNRFLWVIVHTCEVTSFSSVEASKGCWC